MSDPLHERLRHLFDLAFALPPTQRAGLLARECAGDATLRRRLEAMLAAADGEQFLATPTDAGAPTAAPELEEAAGTRIGGYVLLEPIGEGGFGIVFRAEQREPVVRRVALKIIKLGMDTKQVVARFEQERQALALMDHPHIAKVFDAGATATGRPYFVMELVQGEPIVAFSDRHQLTIDERLELFAQVCAAVEHAHGKGIIHRDLKPSNVLVGMVDGKPQAKIIDFGIAKATAQRLTDKTVFTEQRQVIGTLQYMSPEQAEGSPDIDTRTDVYALGVVLYELLTGSTPFTTKTLGAAVYAELQRLIRDVDPPKPSTRISQESEGLAHLAARRRVAPQRLGALVRGEIDWIVMKALEKDRTRRYRTATSLGDDVRRYLLGEPVLAVPPAASYRLRKFVRRHRVLVGATGAVVAALALGVIGFAWQASRIRAQERRATALAADVLSLSAFQELQELVERAEALWPAVPTQVPAYDRWLADARQLLDGRPADAARGIEARPGVREHEASLASIRTRALPGTADGVHEFADARDRWWHTQLVRLLGELRKFGDPARGLATAGNDPEHGWGIVKRREFAATVAPRSLDGDDARQRWNEATAAIAASPRYGGLQLRPQLGLVPLGPDPESGLWEFGHLQTGEPATRRADGSLELLEASGLVFVLLPGGTFAMGAQRTDPHGPNHDPQALPVEGPVHTVALSPFFLSKYEMTQAQWLHCTGVNPSHLRPDKRQPSVKSLLHPVEQVSWTMCRTQLERMQLALPSEAQWEYGTRAGTSTVWWTGDARESLRGAVNIADQAAARSGAPWTDIQDWPELDDGFVMHAPVASLRANAFGLHGVHGNVFEWCFDGYDPKFYASSPTQDPVRAIEGTTTRVNRGGCFSNTAALARSANRPSDPPQTADRYLGVRPARAIL